MGARRETNYCMNLTLLIGVAGSGKSRYGKDFCLKNDYYYISTDQIRYTLTGDEADQSQNHHVFKLAFSEVDYLLSQNQRVLFDATNYSKKNRKQLIEIGRAANAYISAKVFRTPLAICLERNKNRSRVVPTDVIFRQHSNFQYPEFNEGFDSIENI